MKDQQVYVKLTRLNDHMHFKAVNEFGRTVEFDGSPGIGGSNLGVRPMETVLMCLGACSAIDVVIILKKMKQQIDSFDMEINGIRVPDNDASVYGEINMHFTLSGDISEKKLKKAIKLSIEKYCSVAKILEKTARISATYSIKDN